MNVLFCASEAAPFAASGGLGDVAGSLPRAIRNRKVACRVVMPLYGDMKQEYREKLTYITNFTVPVGWRNQYCGLFELTHNGVKYYFLDNEYYFKRTGLYGFYDDGERFAFFSRAILEINSAFSQVFSFSEMHFKIQYATKNLTLFYGVRFCSFI